MLISEDYRRLNAELHAKWGPKKMNKRVDGIIQWVKSHVEQEGITSVLDYGCGWPGHLRLQLGDVVRNYDPAIPEFAAMPEPAEFVVCTGAIEHVEPEYLDNVLDHLKSLTLRRIFIEVPRGKSRQVLSDGRNAHLTTKTREWWAPKFKARWRCVKEFMTDTGQTYNFVGENADQ